MADKNNIVVFSAVFLIVGVCIGWMIAVNTQPKVEVQTGMHMMDSGQMMRNGSMNMDDMMESMMSGLAGKTGDAFDKAFLTEMIVHHQGAVDMAQAVLETSKRSELLRLAHDIIEAQTKEIQIMKDWQKTWFGETK
jgi:uncharacterized protein (DUF305 family)